MRNFLFKSKGWKMPVNCLSHCKKRLIILYSAFFSCLVYKTTQVQSIHILRVFCVFWVFCVSAHDLIILQLSTSKAKHLGVACHNSCMRLPTYLLKLWKTSRRTSGRIQFYYLYSFIHLDTKLQNLCIKKWLTCVYVLITQTHVYNITLYILQAAGL